MHALSLLMEFGMMVLISSLIFPHFFNLQNIAPGQKKIMDFKRKIVKGSLVVIPWAFLFVIYYKVAKNARRTWVSDIKSKSKGR